MLSKTELEYAYVPSRYFESEMTFAIQGGVLRIDEGRAVVTLAEPRALTAGDLLAFTEAVRNVFLAREVLAHSRFKLDGPSIVQQSSDGRRDVTLHVHSARVEVRANSPEFVSRIRMAGLSLTLGRKGSRSIRRSSRCWLRDCRVPQRCAACFRGTARPLTSRQTRWCTCMNYAMPSRHIMAAQMRHRHRWGSARPSGMALGALPTPCPSSKGAIGVGTFSPFDPQPMRSAHWLGKLRDEFSSASRRRCSYDIFISC